MLENPEKQTENIHSEIGGSTTFYFNCKAEATNTARQKHVKMRRIWQIIQELSSRLDFI